MRGLVVSFLVASASGCGFSGWDPGAAVDAAPGDGPLDGDAADPPVTCFARWHDGTLAFGAPVQLLQLANPEIDRDPFLTSDELSLYFSSYRGGSQDGDIYVATRASLAVPFGAPVPRTDVSSDEPEGRLTMTSDQLVAVISSRRDNGRGGTDLWMATRGSTGELFGALQQDKLAAVNDGSDQYDPELSSDGLRLYFSGGSPQRIVVAERASRDAAFGAAQDVGGIQGGSSDADPSLSSDERILVFASNRPGVGAGDLWYARRATTSGPFEAPILVPGLNTTSSDGDPALSPDGCRLYFASNRTGNYELFVAEMTPL
ncbi:MAG: TolB family protein [Kofleriaceae bacterium]